LTARASDGDTQVHVAPDCQHLPLLVALFLTERASVGVFAT